MPQLQITINIDDNAVEGHQLNKLAKDFGEDDASILGRIAGSNQDAAGHRAEPSVIALKAIAAAVRSAEAE